MSAAATRLRRVRRTVAPVVKHVAAEAAYRTGVYHALGRQYAGTGVIIMLHRVCPDDRPILYPGYMVPVSAVDRLLRLVRAAGWDVVTLDEVRRRLEHGDTRRRFACFTFDDGYADNLTLALPVFRKHAAPMAVYIVNGFLDRRAVYWWGALEDLVLKTDAVRVPACEGSAPRTLRAGTLDEKRAAYDVLDDMGHQYGDRFFEALQPIWRQAGIDPGAALDRDALTLAQARVLAHDPLVTIGAHTISHARLSTLPAEEASREVIESRIGLERALEVGVRHFAYPFGGANACGPREFEMVRKAGYATAVTTRRGNLFPEHKSHFECLPRRNVPTTRRHTWAALYGVETLRRREPRFRTV
jgi:peptidoglycan/xylan/chitin deacetylase (PgdA/CDA1 family)